MDVENVGMTDLKESSYRFTSTNFPQHKEGCFWSSMAEATSFAIFLGTQQS